MNSDEGQFTVRGLLAIVTACAILAAILRFSRVSMSAVAIGIGAGMVIGIFFVVAGGMFDSIERRAQRRWAKHRAAMTTENPSTDESAAPV